MKDLEITKIGKYKTYIGETVTKKLLGEIGNHG